MEFIIAIIPEEIKQHFFFLTLKCIYSPVHYVHVVFFLLFMYRYFFFLQFNPRVISMFNLYFIGGYREIVMVLTTGIAGDDPFP